MREPSVQQTKNEQEVQVSCLIEGRYRQAGRGHQASFMMAWRCQRGSAPRRKGGGSAWGGWGNAHHLTTPAMPPQYRGSPLAILCAVCTWHSFPEDKISEKARQPHNWSAKSSLRVTYGLQKAVDHTRIAYSKGCALCLQPKKQAAPGRNCDNNCLPLAGCSLSLQLQTTLLALWNMHVYISFARSLVEHCVQA